MRLFFLPILLVLAFDILTKAQTTPSEVKNVWRFYNEVQSNIKKEAYLVDVYITNALRSNWNKAVLARKKESYFYSLISGDSLTLTYLTVAIDSISVHYQTEFLFSSEGKLIYCVERQDDPKNHYRHLTLFLKNNEVVQLREGNIIVQSSLLNYKRKIDFLKASAQYYYQKFKDYSDLALIVEQIKNEK